MFSKVILPVLFLCSYTVSAYKLDASCTNKGVETEVRNAMTSAFQMVDAALRRLRADPYDQETTDLIKRLFIAKDGQDPNDRDRISKVSSILESINRNYRNEVTTGRAPETDVVSFDMRILR